MQELLKQVAGGSSVRGHPQQQQPHPQQQPQQQPHQPQPQPHQLQQHMQMQQAQPPQLPAPQHPPPQDAQPPQHAQQQHPIPLQQQVQNLFPRAQSNSGVRPGPPPLPLDANGRPVPLLQVLCEQSRCFVSTLNPVFMLQLAGQIGGSGCLLALTFALHPHCTSRPKQCHSCPRLNDANVLSCRRRRS